MASTIRIASTVSGTLNGVAHSLSGNRTIQVNGINAESFDVTTAYSDINYDNTIKVERLLISNDGADEIKVRIERESATTWDYHIIPAGRAMEFLNNDTTVGGVGFYTVSIKAMNTTSRVTVLQAWL